MKLGFDAKRLYNNFTGLGNYSRTAIDILTAEYPDNDYYLYSPKVRLNGTTLPYIGKRHCHTVTPKGIMRGKSTNFSQLPYVRNETYISTKATFLRLSNKKTSL